MILEYSIGYFLADLLHYFVFYPTDVLFIAHHLATLYAFLTYRFVVHHGAANLIGLVPAEITSPFQNTLESCQGNSWTLVCLQDGVGFASGKADGVISRPMWIS
ncbi:hypothetical protein BC332_28227 [Capsicum chinense]|nr:hypothetical protein BC332_28227 [Capsicum chinense]